MAHDDVFHLGLMAELNAACRAADKRNRRRSEREESIRRQLAEREQRDRELAVKPSQTYEEFLAEMTARGLPIGRREPRIQASVVRAKYGLSEAQWDAIPDLPDSHEDRAANGLPSIASGHGTRTAADLAARKARQQSGKQHTAEGGEPSESPA